MRVLSKMALALIQQALKQLLFDSKSRATANPMATPPNKSPSTWAVSGNALRNASRKGRKTDEPR